jgi:hypothetical protein
MMTKRNPIVVVLLAMFTGVYGLYWLVKTKGELVSRGAQIPTAWLLIVPIANLFWVWKFCQGVEHVTGGKTSAGLLLVALFVFSPAMFFLAQSGLNAVAELPAGGGGMARAA